MFHSVLPGRWQDEDAVVAYPDADASNDEIKFRVRTALLTALAWDGPGKFPGRSWTPRWCAVLALVHGLLEPTLLTMLGMIRSGATSH